VFGAKKLKAIAVRGTGSIHVHDPINFMKYVNDCWRKIAASQVTTMLSTGGTLTYSKGGGGWNVQDESWLPEKFTKLTWEQFRDKHETHRLACFNCPVYCSHFYTITDGPYAGTSCEGLEANTARAFGATLDIDYTPAIIKAQALCSQLGIDVDFAAAVLGWAFECYQRGVLTNSETSGLELTWGNHDAALKLLENIAHRTGLGDLLADGVKRASAELGQGSEQWAFHIKGADLNEANMRPDKAWALGICAASRGGGHLEGAPLTSMIKQQASPESLRERLGVDDIGSITSYEHKERLVIWYERFKAVADCLGMCYLPSQWMSLDLLGLEDYASLFTSATGRATSHEQLMHIGRRIHNIQKAFNMLHTDFQRRDDAPPPRLMTTPVKSGDHAGQVLDKDDWDRFLTAYYQAQGWDPVTGQLTESVLNELNLQDVADKLKRYGKL
jgi:aldehyde:ferredoxin oxidoreductase